MSELIIIPGQTERFDASFKIGKLAIDLTGVQVSLEGAPASVTVTNAKRGQVGFVISASATAQITRRQRVRFKRETIGGDIALDPWFWLVPG